MGDRNEVVKRIERAAVDVARLQANNGRAIKASQYFGKSVRTHPPLVVSFCNMDAP